jgi:hypothetical protein
VEEPAAGYLHLEVLGRHEQTNAFVSVPFPLSAFQYRQRSRQNPMQELAVLPSTQGVQSFG